MLPVKNLSDLTGQHFIDLVDNAVGESRTIDFKIALPTDQRGREEIAADVCAFANTIGGDICFGVKESGGQAVELVPLCVENLDHALQQLSNALRDTLEPSVSGLQFSKLIPYSGGILITLRVPQSFAAPHRRRNGHFYARTSVGKEPMDVHALRNAFGLANEFPARVRDFRDERIQKLKQRQLTPTPIAGPWFVAHVVPLSAMIPATMLSMPEIQACAAAHLRPLAMARGCNPGAINFDGAISFETDTIGNAIAHTQLFRNGILEIAQSLKTVADRKNLPISRYEDPLKRGEITKMLIALEAIGIVPPAYVCVSLLGVGGQTLRSDGFETFVIPETMPDLLLPEAYLDSTTPDYDVFWRPLLNMVWQAGGLLHGPGI